MDIIQALNFASFLFALFLESSYLKTILPFAPVRALTVFAGPIPPELTADTLMT